MAFSIEGRYPLLDYRIVEWAMAVPHELNLRRGWNKLLIRDAMADILPPQIRWRRSKVGFDTPQSEWIRTDLRSAFVQWAERPSERLLSIVERTQLESLVDGMVNAKHIHRMDERQRLCIRLFFLDRWLNLFDVAV